MHGFSVWRDRGHVGQCADLQSSPRPPLGFTVPWGPMPELPNIVVYVDHLNSRVTSHTLEAVRLRSVFLLRSVQPPLRETFGKRVLGVGRLGKRITFALQDDLYLIVHLVVAGRLHWKPKGAPLTGRAALAAFDFDSGTLVLTEAGTKRRASLHVVRGREIMDGMNPGGLEVLEADFNAFHQALTRENHTVKRALTDPHLFSGIGNSYSDEILHRARISPVKTTERLDDTEIRSLYEAARSVLSEWIDRLRADAADRFPERVTAFRPDMAVHGRYGLPCPTCGALVQRIVYAENETNYCPKCQTGGRLLADRSLSRLLRDDWPRTPEELDELRAPAASGSRMPSPHHEDPPPTSPGPSSSPRSPRSASGPGRRAVRGPRSSSE